MKRKDLYNYVREEIINELTIVTKNTSSDEIPNIAKAEKTDPNSVKKAVDAAKASGKDVNIAELARKGRNIQMGENFTTIKDVYAGSMIERILDVVEEAGEEGITPKNIMTAVGIKFSSVLNPIVGELIELGAVTGPAPKEAEVEPEKTTPEDDLVSLGIPKVTDNPEEEDVKDEWEKPEEEDSTEEEPKDIAISDKEAEKMVGGKSYAQKLPPEDEEKYTKLKKGIESKVAKLMDMTKAKRETSDDIKILKQLINRDDVKKLFKAKGINLKDLTADIF